MSKLARINIFLISMLVFISSCEVVAGIFKAGVWVGVISVAVVIGLIVYFVAKIF